MSACGQTEEESGSEELGAAGASVRDMYEQKAVSKVVRVLTVLAYLLSVSLAAILLSVYYVCVWQSPQLPKLNDTGEGGRPSAMRVDPPINHITAHKDYPYHTNNTRGGNSTVGEAVTSPPDHLTSLPAESEPPDPDPPADPAPATTPEDLNATWTVPGVTTNATDQR